MNIQDLSLIELRDAIIKGNLSSKEVVEFYLDRIEKLDGKVKAFVEVFGEDALKRAEEVDKRRKGLLCGIPVAIKDNICIKGKKTSCSSRMLRDFVSPYSATVVEKLLSEGAVILGRTNMDEFAMGSSTEHSAYFPTRNPFDLSRVPGGSSGGSAACVSASMAPCALGSDTGGSIRQPASFCGVTGMKPTYGMVSRFGLVAFASSLDQIGPIARSAEDCALMMEVISGYDPKDSTSYPGAPGYSFLEKLGVSETFTLGIPREFSQSEGVEEDVIGLFDAAREVFKGMGFRVVDVSLPRTFSYSVATYYIIATAEASSNLARYDGVRYGLRVEGEDIIDMFKRTRSEGFGREVKRRIMLGTYVLSSGYYDAYYLKAQRVRRLIRDEILVALKDCDAIIVPTSPTVPFRLGEKLDDPLKMYLSDVFTIPANLAGIPAISIPCGFSNSLPVGLQILGRPFEDWKVINIAHRFQKETAYHRQKPSLEV